VEELEGRFYESPAEESHPEYSGIAHNRSLEKSLRVFSDGHLETGPHGWRRKHP
jgi:hypothetical protein